MQDLWCCRQLNTAEKLQKQLFRGQGYISFIEGIRTDQHKNKTPSNNQNKNTYLHSCKAIWKQLKCLLLQLVSGKVNNWVKCLLSSVLWMGWNDIDGWLMHCHEEKCVTVSLFYWLSFGFLFQFVPMFSWQVKLYGSRKKKSNFFYDYCNTVFYGLYIVKQYCIFHTCTTLQEFGSYTDSFHWEQEFEPCSLGIVLVVGYVHTIEKINELHKD